MSTKKKKQSTPKIGDIRLKSRELGIARGRVSRSFDAPRIAEIKRVEDTILRTRGKSTKITIVSDSTTDRKRVK